MHVPVWHEKTKELVAKGELQLVGIVQEQHPDRAALYAQWQEFDFPLLWDPFGVMGLEVVPVVAAVDEHGVVRAGRLDPRRFEESFMKGFMDVEFPAPSDGGGADARPSFLTSVEAKAHGKIGGAIARLMLGGVQPSRSESQSSDGVSDVDWLAARDGSPYELFVGGVAMRLRYDGGAPVPGDFQGALDRWSRALALRPNQYIWRRRIQQWGPRLDKPYPFYDWVGTAQAEVASRDLEPVAVRARLSGSEVAGKTRRVPGSRSSSDEAQGKVAVEPDPAGKLKRDDASLAAMEVAVAPHTASAGGSVRSPMGSSRIHVQLRPQAGAKWPLDAEPPLVWLKLPEGWNAESQAVSFAMPGKGDGAGPLGVDFELSTQALPLGPPDEMPPPPPSSIPAYAVYSICLEDGTCVFRRQDFVIEVSFPAPPQADQDR